MFLTDHYVVQYNKRVVEEGKITDSTPLQFATDAFYRGEGASKILNPIFRREVLNKQKEYDDYSLIMHHRGFMVIYTLINYMRDPEARTVYAKKPKIIFESDVEKMQIPGIGRPRLRSVA